MALRNQEGVRVKRLTFLFCGGTEKENKVFAMFSDSRLKISLKISFHVL
jgi:hypothetical protein